MKKYWITAVFFSIGIAAILCAADPGACIIAQAGTSESGEALFTKYCAVCHSDSGAASVITPQSKPADEWKKWFQTGKHLGQDLTTITSQEHIEKIRDYCMDHAPENIPESTPENLPENTSEKGKVTPNPTS